MSHLAKYPFEPYSGTKLRVCVAGAGGFIGSHLAKRLKSEGHFVVACDWKRNEYMPEGMFCDEFHLVDLRVYESCKHVTAGCNHVFNFAADMGGIGFIQSNHAVILYNNTMVSFNMLEASRQNKVERYFFASSACCYPTFKLGNPDINSEGLKESDAWPAQPEDAYGLEKLSSEELCMHYMREFGIECRIARFHGIYGPYGTWKGGREKSAAAFCRKVLTSDNEVEIWGDGEQTRTYTYIDDCVEGVLRITKSNYRQPLNLGSSELVSMNELLRLVMSFEDKCLEVKHIPGPQGARGRNSDNTLILSHLGWEPTISLHDGLSLTYEWIKTQIAKELSEGNDVSQYATSKVGGFVTPTSLGCVQ